MDETIDLRVSGAKRTVNTINRKKRKTRETPEKEDQEPPNSGKGGST